MTTFSGTFSGTVSGRMVSGRTVSGTVPSKWSDRHPPSTAVARVPRVRDARRIRRRVVQFGLRSFVSFFVPVVKPGPALNTSPSSLSESSSPKSSRNSSSRRLAAASTTSAASVGRIPGLSRSPDRTPRSPSPPPPGESPGWYVHRESRRAVSHRPAQPPSPNSSDRTRGTQVVAVRSPRLDRRPRARPRVRRG